jgi:hypothetical protein
MGRAAFASQMGGRVAGDAESCEQRQEGKDRHPREK